MRYPISSLYAVSIYSAHVVKGHSVQQRFTWRAVANGLQTDHPIAELPFVDDDHIPVDDPAAIERIGRKHGTGTWGRQDRITQRDGAGWVAFTTDPQRADLAWLVRWHPQHGRSVVLYRDEDAAPVHMAYWSPALLFRAGGYWWDGQTWYRPAQIWDGAAESYVRRPVPAAATTTVAGLRAVGGDPDRGRILPVTDVDPDQPPTGRWADHLALWTARHIEHGGLALEQCVVGLTAPELAADQLLGQAELAAVAGVAASTMRAYQSRGEGDIPLPQATVAGRSMWSRPVAEEYAEARRQDPAAIAATLHTHHAGVDVAPGIAALWQRLTRTFVIDLWDDPTVRRRWALRWRTKTSVGQVAERLGWSVAAGLDRIVPLPQLGVTLRHAILADFAQQQASQRDLHADAEYVDVFFGLAPAIETLLRWYIRHAPELALGALREIIGEAERSLNIPRDVTHHSLATAVTLAAGRADEDDATYETFFDQLLPAQH